MIAVYCAIVGIAISYPMLGYNKNLYRHHPSVYSPVDNALSEVCIGNTCSNCHV